MIFYFTIDSLSDARCNTLHNIPRNFMQKRENKQKKLVHVTNVSRSHLVGAMNRLMPNKNISTVKHLCLIVSFTIFLEELKDKWFRKEVKW